MSGDFGSDNVTGAHPAILEALVAANHGTAASYGADEVTRRVAARLAEIFEREVAVFPVISGTAANSLALAQLCPPWGAVLCEAGAHVAVDECGAPTFFTGGATLSLIDGIAGRLQPADVAARIAQTRIGDQHQVQPAALTLTQATECGTVYQPAEVAALAELAHGHGLAMHMDGARFANALAHLGCAPAEITWKAGIDVLSLGATKNGALMAEAVIFFDPGRSADFLYRRKRAGHLVSKMRFVSAQLDAWLTDGLWLRLAAHANAAARRLSDGLAARGYATEWPVEANEVFVRLPTAVAEGLEVAGFHFYPWGDPPAAGAPGLYRLVTAWNTPEADVDAFVARLEALSSPR
jgi:threonine aldolase